jgi:phosphatidate cytidylyltransferase
MNVLKQRILTGIGAGAALLIVLLLLPEGVALGVFALVVLIGAWEWSAFPKFRSPISRYAYVLFVAGLMAVAWNNTRRPLHLEWLVWTTIAWWVIAFFWVALAPARHNRVTVIICGILVLVPAWVALAHLYEFPGGRAADGSGPYRVLFLLCLIGAADIGAFFAGRAYGSVKLAPRVSPSKTWEGVLGGVVASALVAVIGALWFDVPRLAFLSLCVAVVLISIVGDLTESMFKRYAGLKDSGSVFPGHGGVLDRIDSVTAAAPVFLLGTQWLESLP